MSRVPATLNAGVKKFFCGPESFTPDLSPIVVSGRGGKGKGKRKGKREEKRTKGREKGKEGKGFCLFTFFMFFISFWLL